MSRAAVESSSALRTRLIDLAVGFGNDEGGWATVRSVARKIPFLSSVTQAPGLEDRKALVAEFVATLTAIEDPDHSDLHLVQTALTHLETQVKDKKVGSGRFDTLVTDCKKAIAEDQAVEFKHASTAMVVRADIPEPPKLPLPASPAAAPELATAPSHVPEDKGDDAEAVEGERSLFSEAAVARYKALNFYQRLEVAQNAASREIRESFRRLALVLAPDKQRTADTVPAATALFQLLCQAYQTLNDGDRRREYTAKLTDAEYTDIDEEEPFQPDRSAFADFGTDVLHAFDQVWPKSTGGRAAVVAAIATGVGLLALASRNRGGAAAVGGAIRHSSSLRLRR